MLAKGGRDHIEERDLAEIERVIMDRDPEVIHAAREIDRILVKPAIRIDIKILRTTIPTIGYIIDCHGKSNMAPRNALLVDVK
jgi:hypothetical protein